MDFWESLPFRSLTCEKVYQMMSRKSRWTIFHDHHKLNFSKVSITIISHRSFRCSETFQKVYLLKTRKSLRRTFRDRHIKWRWSPDGFWRGGGQGGSRWLVGEVLLEMRLWSKHGVARIRGKCWFVGKFSTVSCIVISRSVFGSEWTFENAYI